MLTLIILSGFNTSNEQQPGILKTRNNNSRSVLLLSNYCNAITSKKIIKSKCTNCNQSHNPLSKCIKITEKQKLAGFIYEVLEELKLFCERKTEPTEQALKQLVELNRDNSRLLLSRLTLLQDDCEVLIFLLLSEDIQKLWLSSKCNTLLSKNS